MKIPQEWLKERVALEQLLAEHDFDSCYPSFRADWERLLSKKQDRDELWRFGPPPRGIFVRGVALARDGEIISSLVEAVG
jgi:hypothetical protein